MSAAAVELERACLARGCRYRCNVASIAGASDEILRDIQACLSRTDCDRVDDCAAAAIVARGASC